MVNETYEPHPNVVLDRIKQAVDYSDKQKRNEALTKTLSLIGAIGLELLVGYSAITNLNHNDKNAPPAVRRACELDKELFGLCSRLEPVDAIASYKKDKEFAERYDVLAKERSELEKAPEFATQMSDFKSAQSHEVNNVVLYSVMILASYVASLIGIEKFYKSKMNKAPSISDLFQKKD